MRTRNLAARRVLGVGWALAFLLSLALFCAQGVYALTPLLELSGAPETEDSPSLSPDLQQETPTPEATPTAAQESSDEENPDEVAINLGADCRVSEGRPGDRITIRIPLEVNDDFFQDGWQSLSDISIEAQVSDDVAQWPFTLENISYEHDLPALERGQRVEAVFEFQIERQAAAGEYNLPFSIRYNAWSGAVGETPATVHPGAAYVECGFRVLESDAPSEGTPVAAALVLMDEAGEKSKTPKGNAGETITLRLPLKSNGKTLTDIELMPDISSDTKEFPFVVEDASVVHKLDDMASDETVVVEYRMKIAENATKGKYDVGFTMLYREDGVAAESKFRTAVEVVAGAEPAPRTNAPKATPKPEHSPALVCQYELLPPKVKAGEAFSLLLTLRNNAEKDEMRNVTLSWKCIVLSSGDAGAPSSVITADDGQSDARFIESIAAQSEASEKLALVSTEDAGMEPIALALTIAYEGKDSHRYKEIQTIRVPIRQPVDVAIDDVAVETENVDPDAPFAVDLTIRNKGKRPIYNVDVNVEGDALALQEGYHGESIGSDAKEHAIIKLVASQPGVQSANLRLTYEDEYGETYSQQQFVKVSVSAPVAVPTPVAAPPIAAAESMKSGALRLAAIVGLPLILIALVLFALLRRKKRP